jgi:hypothetical protein
MAAPTRCNAKKNFVIEVTSGKIRSTVEQPALLKPIKVKTAYL